MQRYLNAGLKSPLAWGRGLKPVKLAAKLLKIWSPLAWGRGLKLLNLFSLGKIIVSPLAWGRGLKRFGYYEKVSQISKVAPRVGAWIETAIGSMSNNNAKSPLAWGRGLKL